MTDFGNTQYILSCPDVSYRPKDGREEVALLGRSNVGKSSLINALTGHNVAKVAKTAGKTRYLNYFLVDGAFYLVDSPGYGYVAGGPEKAVAFAPMMDGYLGHPLLKGALLLVDSRRGVAAEDASLIALLRQKKVPFVLVFTKRDKIGQKAFAALSKAAGEAGLPFYYAGGALPLAPIRAAVLAFLQ